VSVASMREMYGLTLSYQSIAGFHPKRYRPS
jgi:hypothetical protein